MSAAVIVHPKAFRGPAGTVALLRLAVRLGCELVSSRRGNVMLVRRVNH
ncbi:MAG TPA: hypothetical protein VFP70_09585 [Burkholderiales bacterium]|nr:hypothetical protein [Burkholderiales bacterium]